MKKFFLLIILVFAFSALSAVDNKTKKFKTYIVETLSCIKSEHPHASSVTITALFCMTMTKVVLQNYIHDYIHATKMLMDKRRTIEWKLCIIIGNLMTVLLGVTLVGTALLIVMGIVLVFAFALGVGAFYFFSTLFVETLVLLYAMIRKVLDIMYPSVLGQQGIYIVITDERGEKKRCYV